MSVHFYSDDEEDDNVQDTSNDLKITGRDSVIFAVECTEEMFNDEEENSPFFRVVSAIHDMMLNKIITSDKDMHGVLFFGTSKHKNSNDFSSIYEWLQFDVPSIQCILDLRKMMDCNKEQFKTDFGMKKGYQISDVLWSCLNMFSGSNYSLANKTLLLFPWNDNPHAGDDNARKRAKAKATDLHEHKVDVQVLSFNKNFTYQYLYKDVLFDGDNPESIYDNPIDSIENLYSYLLRKCSKQRPLTRVLLRLGNEVDLSVGVYTVTRRARKSDHVTIDTTTNEEVTRKNTLLDGGTGEILMPSDVKLLQKWGGKDLVFEKEEVAQMRKIIKRGLNLLGFKPRTKAIKPWYHVRNAQFIYPDETTVQGSSSLFHALLIKCLEKDVVAICSYAMRDSSPPRCVALLPQDEKVDPETLQQISPPGFFIIFLPFADDIRKFDISRDHPEPSSEQVDAAEKMIKNLSMKFDPENFDNPVIQTHYKNLEAMALDKSDADPIDDYTIPNFDKIEEIAGDQIRRFKEICGLNEVLPKKRGPGASGDELAAKKAKEEYLQVDVKEYIAKKKLNKLTVQGLKEICKSYGIKASGKKADIIAAIENHF